MSLMKVCEFFGQKELNPKNIYMGIELEVEGIHYDNVEEEVPASIRKHWDITTDNSLRNGVEFVLKAPKYGNALCAAVVGLAQYLASVSVFLSHRCSLHCHINVRSFTIDDIEKLFRLFTLFEPAMYTVSGKDRYENIYCPGFTHATEQLKNAGAGFSTKDFNILLRNACKYSGFNILPIADKGSVEIRTHKGSLNAQDMLNWIDILHSLFEFARDRSLEDVRALAYLTPEQAVEEVWGRTVQANIILCPSLITFWKHAKLNLLYLDAIDEMLLNYEEPVQTTQQFKNAALLKLVKQKVEELNSCAG